MKTKKKDLKNQTGGSREARQARQKMAAWSLCSSWL